MKGKKKALIALLSALCMGTAVFGFAACNEEGKTPHTHVDADRNGYCDECNEPTPLPSYTVTFDTDGGNELPKQAVVEGQKITKPADPVKDGYVFDGWVNGEGEAFDFNMTVTSDVTVYARWKEAAATADSYFNFSGVEGGVAISAKVGVTLPQDTILPAEHEGKAVVEIAEEGFAYQPALRGLKIPASVKKIGTRAFRGCSALTTVEAEGVEEIGYGAFNSTAWEQALTVGEVYLGKTFYKYAGSLYADTQVTVKEGTVGVAAGAFQGLTRLVGVTLPDSVTNIGTYAFSGTGLRSVTMKASTPATLGANALDGFSGKIFVPKAAVESYRAADSYKKFAASIFAIGTDTETFTVAFSAEGAEDVPAAQSVKGFEKATQPEKAPSKSGYDFGGWYLDEECTRPYDFDSEVTENLTLYAKFGRFYNVNFSTGEGASTVESQHVEAGKAAQRPATDPTKEGSEFAGWYRDEDCTMEFDFSSPITDDTTVYAKFIEKGADYTGTGDYEGWVIKNGALESYTGSKTAIKIPKELKKLDSVTQLVYNKNAGMNQVADLKKITSIEVEGGSTSFKVVNNTLMSYDETVIYYCFKATNLKYEKAVKIAPYAFAGISAFGGGNYMSLFGFSENLIEVGEYAFYQFAALNGAFDSLFGSVEKVGKFAFFDTAFETIYCNAKYVEESAFEVSGNIAQQYTRIKEIRLPNIVTIGDKAFAIQVSGLDSAKGGLRKVVIGPNCTTVGAGAFVWNVQKSDLDIIVQGDKLPVLANASFGQTGINNDNQYHTKRFVYVQEALLNQAKHENSYLGYPLGFFTADGWGLREDGSFAFYEGDMTSVTLPAAVKSLDTVLDIFSTAANLEKCTSFTVAAENENFKTQDNALVSKDGKTLYGYFGSGAGNFSEVTEIKPYAFYNRLKAGATASFGTPGTVGEYAFYGCVGLTSFTPFENLSAVAAHSFEKSGLTSASLVNAALTAIGEGAFAGCENLKLYVKLLTPPTLPAKAVDATCELYVPQEIVGTYTAAWASYAQQIKADTNTHVYTVTFDTDTENGGTEVANQQYLTGGKVVRPETDPTKTGYYFDGWYTQDGSENGNWGTEYNFETSNVTDNITIYAKWTKGVTVTYDTGESGAEVAGEMIYPGKTLTEPETPKWKGHVFRGWYKDQACSEGQEFDFTKDAIKEDTTLYAKWDLGKTVTFSTGEGGSQIDDQPVAAGESVERPAEDPTRPGYKFVDWYTKDGTETGDWGDVFNFETYKMGDTDLTIYAKWEEDFWQIDEDGKLTKYYGPTDTVELPAAVKSITNILDIFGVKANLAACTSFTVAGESTSFKMQNGALLSYDGTTLYAFFGDEAAELTWESVTAIGESAFYGHLATAKKLAFSKELASVGKGAFESCAGMTDFTPFENATTIGADAFKSTKLVDIVWNGTTVPAAFGSITTLKTVKFMKATTITANAFTGSSAITTIYLGDKMKTIGQAAFYSAGNGKHRVDVYVYATTPPTLYKTSSVKSAEHPFGGDGSKSYVYFHVPNSALATYKQSSRVNWNWYAANHYSAITVNVTYHMGEGEGAPAAPTAAVNWGATFAEPAAPKWKGKIFAGWYTSSDFSEDSKYTAFGTIIKEESLELWAKWEDNGLWVEFNVGEGASAVDWQAVRSGEKATRPDAPTKSGYEFLGWFTKDGTDGDWGEQFNFESEITQNTTLYAKWEQGALVTFDMNGGTKPSGFTTPVTVKKGDHVPAPAKNPTRSGWTFEGWWTKDGDEDGDWGEQFDFETDTVSEDTTLYAKWNPWVLDADGFLKSYAGDKTGTINIPADIKIKDITGLLGTSVSSFPKEAIAITVAAENTYLKVVGNALVSYDGKTLYYYFGADASYTSEDIETLAPYAFAVNASFTAKDTLTSVTLAKVTAISASCFYNRGGLETLSFGTLAEIGASSFYNAKIASFELFKDLTAIPDNAFTGANFVNKEIAVNAATIGTMAFYKAGFTKLTLGENVTSIASNGFNGIANGGIVILNCASVPTVDKNFPFGNGGSGTFIGVFVVPKGRIETYKKNSGFVTAKLADAKYVEADNYDEVDGGWVVDKSGKLLAYSGDLATVVIPAEVKSMDSILDIFGAGANIATCTSLTVAAENTSFKVENDILADYETGKIVYMYLAKTAPSDLSTVTEIKPYAFYNKTAITEVTLTAVTKVGSYAFYGCSALKTITIGEKCTEIGSYAFGSIATGTTCTINATTPPTLGTYVFGTTTSKVTVKVPAANVDTYKADASWSLYKSRVTAQS